jgi:O-succinylbenzoic acid--CoA ligase
MINNMVKNVASIARDNIAVVQGTFTWSYDQLRRNANACGNVMFADGVMSGQVVMFIANDTAILLAAVIGACGLGAIPLVITPGASYSKMKAVDADACAAHIYDQQDLARLFQGSGEDLPILNRADEDIAFLFGSSGTTAPAKLSAASVKAMAFRTRQAHIALNMQPGDRLICSIPLSSAMAMRYTMGALASGAAVVLRHAGCETCTEPAMANDAVTHLVTAGNDLPKIIASSIYGVPTLKRIVACIKDGSPEQARQFGELFKVPTTWVYGLSELGTVLATETFAPGQLGTPADGVEVRIVDGELFVRSDRLMSGYWVKGVLDPVTTEDGWFQTGDMVSSVDDHFIFNGRRALDHGG